MSYFRFDIGHPEFDGLRLVLNRHKFKTGQIYQMCFGHLYDGVRQAAVPEREHIPFPSLLPMMVTNLI